MQQPMRGSMFLTAFSTSRGECQSLSSGPWLWMASRMSYSFTNFSMRGRVSGVGSPATMTEMPARLQYSNLLRMSASSSLRKVDGAGGVELDAGGFVVGDGLGFRGRVHRQMILRVFGVEVGDAELLHEARSSGRG